MARRKHDYTERSLFDDGETAKNTSRLEKADGETSSTELVVSRLKPHPGWPTRTLRRVMKVIELRRGGKPILLVIDNIEFVEKEQNTNKAIIFTTAIGATGIVVDESYDAVKTALEAA